MEARAELGTSSTGGLDSDIEGVSEMRPGGRNCLCADELDLDLADLADESVAFDSGRLHPIGCIGGKAGEVFRSGGVSRPCCICSCRWEYLLSSYGWAGFEKARRAVALPLSFGSIAKTAWSSFSLAGGLNGGLPKAGLDSGTATRAPKSNAPMALTVGEGLAVLMFGMLALLVT